MLGALVLGAGGLALIGCGGGSPGPRPPPGILDPSYLPLTVGPGPRYRPPPGAGAEGRPVGGGGGRLVGGAGGRSARWVCRAASGRRGLHLELFAYRHVVIVPAGIGVVGGRREGAVVRGGGCLAALITRDPTGVVELDAAAGRARLRDLFATWGQPLSPTRLAGFRGATVRAYVDGRAVPGDAGQIVLGPHQEVVLEIGGHVEPHRGYRFPAGL